MSPQDAIEILCHAQSKAANLVIGHDEASDCVCGRGGYWEGHKAQWPEPYENFLNTGRAAEYVLLATTFCALSGITPKMLEGAIRRLQEGAP